MASEKRLIDANALLERVRTQDRIVFFTQRSGKTYEAFKQFLAELLKYTPTVDAVEVVRGRWEETLVPDGYVQKASRMRKKCSICGWTNACRYKYCPTCGAKMDGERKDND